MLLGATSAEFRERLLQGGAALKDMEGLSWTDNTGVKEFVLHLANPNLIPGTISGVQKRE